MARRFDRKPGHARKPEKECERMSWPLGSVSGLSRDSSPEESGSPPAAGPTASTAGARSRMAAARRAKVGASMALPPGSAETMRVVVEIVEAAIMEMVAEDTATEETVMEKVAVARVVVDIPAAGSVRGLRAHRSIG